MSVEIDWGLQEILLVAAGSLGWLATAIGLEQSWLVAPGRVLRSTFAWIGHRLTGSVKIKLFRVRSRTLYFTLSRWDIKIAGFILILMTAAFETRERRQNLTWVLATAALGFALLAQLMVDMPNTTNS